jgi:hypothetical protein
MSIEPLGRRLSVYRAGNTWSAILTIAEGLPTRAAAQAAAESFTTPYVAGWRDALRDLFQLWLEAKMWTGETWGVTRITEWLRSAVNRLAPGAAGQ